MFSINKLQYDLCAYKQVLGETTGPGFYQLSTPPNKLCHIQPNSLGLHVQNVVVEKYTQYNISSDLSS